MKKIKMILTSFVMLFCALGVFAQKVTIDYRLNVLSDDGKDYLNWSIDSDSISDGFDATTGASKSQSTKKLNALRYDQDKNKIGPNGLRNILLFALVSPETKSEYGLNVSCDGKKITMYGCRKGKVVYMETNQKGEIDLADSFKSAVIASKDEDGKFVFLPEVLKEGAEDNTSFSNVDFSKVVLEDDVASSEIENPFTGKLKATYKKGILTIKGTITR